MKSIVLVILIILMSACSQVVDIHLPSTPAKLVVNSFFGKDSLMTVSVTRSIPILEDSTYHSIPQVDNAFVVVYDDEKNPFDTLLMADDDGLYHGDRPLSGNKKFSIHVVADGNVVNAVSSLPVAVPVLSAVVDSSRLKDDYISVRFKFKDPAGVKNYYHIFLVLSYDSIRGLSPMALRISDPAYVGAAIENSYGLLIKDDLFDGNEATFRVEYQPYYRRDKLKVVLVSVSEEYYSYFSSRELQGETKGDPFAQPTQVFSNIENGLGIFAGYTSYYYPIPK